MTLRDKLFSFDGRLRRSDWWIWNMVAGLIWMLARAAANQLLFSGEADLAEATIGDPAPVLIASVLINLLTFWPSLALYAKRAHDVNWPAWPIIVFMLVVVGLPYLPYDLAPAFSGEPVTGVEMAVTALTCVFAIAWGVVLIWLAFVDGAPGPNRFGPSPKGLSGGAPAFIEPGGLG
jgi:uncharacterized membrane protein YhaH (DUF805 family)